MPEDEKFQRILEAVSTLAEETKRAKLRESERGIPDWLKWAGTLLVSAVILGVSWANLRRDIDANRDRLEQVDKANRDVHNRLAGFIKTNSKNMRTVWAKVFPGAGEPPDGDGN